MARREPETARLRCVFRARLRSARERRRFTQEGLGLLTDTNQQWINHFETGDRLPSLPKLARLADALSCSTDYLLGLEEWEGP